MTDTLNAWFDADPSLTGRQLLDRLQIEHPGAYPDGLIRTVQRRLKVWRRDRAKALVMRTSDIGGAAGEPFDEALRWLRAPRPAGKLSGSTDAHADSAVIADANQ